MVTRARFKCCVFILGLILEISKAIRQNAESMPDPTFWRSTGCRLIINEFSFSTEDPDKKQFVEIARYCSSTMTYQKKVSMEGAMLLFISYEGYLHGICKFSGFLEPKTVEETIDLGSKKMKAVVRYWFYLVGIGYEGINFPRDNCQLTPYGNPAENKRKFFLGIDSPVGLALVYNDYVNVFKDISLNYNDNVYVRKQLTAKNEVTIRKYLQDFYIYGSKCRFQYCDYYERFYKYQPGPNVMLRDWNVDDLPDKSVSRCSRQAGDRQTLPMQPDLWLSTNPSAGNINLCREGVNFMIEDYQDTRESPKMFLYGANSKLKCYSFTADPANDLGLITSPQNFKQRLQEAVPLIEVETEIDITTSTDSTDISLHSLVVDVESHVDCNENEIILDEIMEDHTVSDDSIEIPVAPIPSQEFESKLEGDKPYIWKDPDCSRFDQSKQKEITDIPGSPIALKDVMQEDICNWFDYIKETNLFRCKLCNMLYTQQVIFDTPKSTHVTPIMKNGVMSLDFKNRKNLNRKYINQHNVSAFHNISRQWFSLYDSGLRAEELHTEFVHKPGPFFQFMKPTKNFIVAVQHAVRLGLPFNKFKMLAELLNYYSVDIGDLYHNLSGMKLAVDVISRKMHSDLIQELLRLNGPITILLDGTTDIQTIPVVAVLFQITSAEYGTRILLYKILKMEKGESGEQLFQAFMNAIDADGLRSVIIKNLHAVTSDGAPNVLNVFNKKLNEITEQNILPVWCQCHTTDLTYRRTIKQYSELQIVSTVINDCYRVFSKSSKRKQVLESVAAKHGVKKYSIKKVHAIRWVSSNIRAFQLFLDNWAYIAETLQNIGNDKAFTKDARTLALKVLTSLKDPMFLTSLAFLCEIGKILSFMSLELEKKGKTLITKKAMRTELKEKLQELKTTEIVGVTFLIKNSVFVDERANKQSVRNLEDFESKPVELFGIPLSLPTDASKNNRLFQMQSKYIDTLIEWVDFYFPENVQDCFEIFNPVKFPTSTADLSSYGKTDLSRLNRDLKWGYTDQELLSDWENLLQGIVAHPQFSVMKPKPAETFWEYYQSQDNVGFSDVTKNVIAKALTISSSNAQSERVLSLYNGVKTYQRFLLQPSTVESILRIRINSDKPINDKDAHEFAKVFVLEGHSRSDAIKRTQILSEQFEWDDMVTYDSGRSEREIGFGGEELDDDGEVDDDLGEVDSDQES